MCVVKNILLDRQTKMYDLIFYVKLGACLHNITYYIT